MPNINAFWPLVHEKKIFEDLTNFFLILPLLGPKNLNPHPPIVFPTKFG